MKASIIITLFLLLTLSLSAKSHSHYHFDGKDSVINNEWIGPRGEYLKINKDTAMVEVFMGSLPKYKVIKQDSILILDWQDSVQSNRPVQKIFYHEERVFKIMYLSADTMIITSIRNESKQWFYNKKLFVDSENIVLVSRKHYYNQPFSLQKIFVSSNGGGLGGAPAHKLEIDSTGKVHFWITRNRGKNAGYYEGQLSAEGFRDFIEILRNSALDRFALPDNRKMIDAVYTNYQFKYDHKTVTLYSCANTPYFGYQLRDYLYNIEQYVSLKKMDTAYDFGK